MLGVHDLRSYLSLICEYELYILPNKKVSTAMDHGKSYMKDRPPLVRRAIVYFFCYEETIPNLDFETSIIEIR